MNGDWIFPLVAIAGLAIITVVTRAFFMLPEREIPMPDWLKRGLKYAPLAALTAVIAPEIAMVHGELISTWQDARLPATLCAALYIFGAAVSWAPSWWAWPFIYRCTWAWAGEASSVPCLQCAAWINSDWADLFHANSSFFRPVRAR